MKRINTYSRKAVCIICFMSFLISICSAQDETEKTPFVPSENISVSNDYEERDLTGTNEETNIDEDKLIFNVDGKEDILGVLAEIASKNVAASNDITIEGATVVLSLPETITSEMKNEAEKLSTALNSNKLNNNNTTGGVKEAISETISIDQKSSDGEELSNGTIVLLNKTKDTPEEIPSFSEWAQKRMEEAEKKFVNESNNVGNNGKLGSGVKLGWKNYASPDCGAKVVAANPEAVSASSVISPSREEYKLNVCTNRIWFIVELCEAIQAKKIDIANFELFSSTPKEFTVSIGDRFPSREWTTVGQFMAKDERDVQSFDLNPHLFGRYIKVEVKSHHGAQHYCPISLFRVYGISELEVLQKEELSQVDDDDMDDNDDSEMYSDGLTKNMLNSATNAVYSMIKKAAEVLSTKSNETNKKNDPTVQFEYSPLINTCSTPRHSIVCGNCSDLLFGQVYELLSCKFDQIHKLAQVPYIRESLIASDVCQYFGISMNPVRNHFSICDKSCLYVKSLFTDKFLAAICNNVAVSENRAVLNNSQQFPNSTKSLVEENVDIGVIGMSKITSGIEQSVDVVLPDNNSESRPTDELKLDLTNNVELPKVSCSTSLEYTSRIKPTKTVTLDVSIESSNILSGSETEELLNHITKVDSPPSEVNGATESKILINDFGDVQDVGDANGQNLYVSTEPPESMDQMEHFMTDINGENGPSTVPPVSSGNNPADRQKESVFLRLSNRIKALERNVSLSSQYLEELSRRYKKQVEEMQNLERTIHSMLEERKKMEEKDKQLEERLENLMITLEKWPSFLFWFLTTITIFCGVFWICGSERKKNTIDLPKDVKRRKSIDIITCKEKKKVRRPSDQALKIVRSSLMAEERKLSLEKRRRKRSNKCLKRSNSINECDINGFRVNNHDTIQDSTHRAGVNTNPGDWVEENHRQIEIVDLDESENSSLDHFATILEKEVPHYAKTAVDRRAHRISSHYIKPNINGDQDFPYSMSKEMEIVENSPKLELKNLERRSSNRSEEGSRKKERKSFRTVLKNVFT
ncbi:SUN domain-containing ossification factor isoform X2 [Coccinella septempunctata]|uniref:SUN domain-containing ossification factor isoform X2 n=1 Tax=Coccinella septempunctata TaxID=41139 RepID=UPI001D07380F|nr:SUN domain-containing ossification factor isoform X2 [Coccinella septempunctata]